MQHHFHCTYKPIQIQRQRIDCLLKKQCRGHIVRRTCALEDICVHSFGQSNLPQTRTEALLRILLSRTFSIWETYLNNNVKLIGVLAVNFPQTFALYGSVWFVRWWECVLSTITWTIIGVSFFIYCLTAWYPESWIYCIMYFLCLYSVLLMQEGRFGSSCSILVRHRNLELIF